MPVVACTEDSGCPPGEVCDKETGSCLSRLDDRTFTWDKGLLSEARVSEIAKSHARLVLGPRAVLTPLARDRARALKLTVERLKP